MACVVVLNPLTFYEAIEDPRRLVVEYMTEAQTGVGV
jgi:hypothetical protein